MLKIKDDINLNELKTLGFKSYVQVWSSTGNVYSSIDSYCLEFEFGDGNYGQTNTSGVTLLKVDPDTRELTEYIDDRFEMYVAIKQARLDAIYELIVNDLVERVD